MLDMGELGEEVGEAGLDDCSAPAEALGDDAEVEACYDAEVVGASFEGFEEVGVSGGVCIDDFTG